MRPALITALLLLAACAANPFADRGSRGEGTPLALVLVPPPAIAVSDSGLLYEFFIGRGRWTWLVTNPLGRSCIMAEGPTARITKQLTGDPV